jgi:hypothetical protein
MEPGHLALMNYGEVPPCWHTRILLARVTDISWVILTPDYDIYAEELSIHNPDLIDFEYLGSNANPPARIPLAQVYGFQPMDPAALANFMRQGSIEANAIRALRGIPNGPVVPVPPAPAAPVAPPPSGVLAPQPPAVVAAPAAPAGAAAAVAGGKCWVCVEDAGGRKKGDIVVHDPGALPAGSLQLGDKALVPALDGSGSACYVKHVPVSEAPNYRLDDLRILPVHFDAQGIRRREFSQAVSMMLDGVPLGGGLQLEGPTSGLNVLKSLRDQSMTPTSFHEFWLRSADIPKGDRSTYEHECLSRILESLVTIDQLNIVALQGAELICRRLQVIREAHRVSPTSPDYTAADYYMGWKYRRGAHGVDSDLTQYVAGEMRNDAAVMKEARKAKEEAQLRRQNPKKGGGGDSK